MWEKTLLKFHRIMVLPTPFYGNEIWTLTKTDFSRYPLQTGNFKDGRRDRGISKGVNVFSVNKKIECRIKCKRYLNRRKMITLLNNLDSIQEETKQVRRLQNQGERNKPG